MTIKEYILEQLEDRTAAEVANSLGISVPMISSYKTQGYNPSLRVATKAYELHKVILRPFSEEGLQHEVNKFK